MKCTQTFPLNNEANSVLILYFVDAPADCWGTALWCQCQCLRFMLWCCAGTNWKS